MKNDRLAQVLAALPDRSALSGIRASIMMEGLKGNLDAAASVFHQFRSCDGCEETKAELAAFFVARYAYRGQWKTARELYALFADLGAAGPVLQARAVALHILACTLGEVRLCEAVSLWRDYARLPIAAPLQKSFFRTGLLLLRQALKNSDARLAARVFAVLHAMIRETGEKEKRIAAS